MQLSLILIPALAMTASTFADEAIRPSQAHPFYWEFRGETAPLIGGSSEDNLYQEPGMEAELHMLAEAGANYVRCSMSSRDPGNLWPFARDNESGLYDLDRWDPAFWDRFERFISIADSLDIVVQIELFDRFDYFRAEWKENPFNPDNNSNYDTAASGLANDYPQHPNAATNPFFSTVPALEDNPAIRHFQEAFLARILGITLPRGNVLYCISNETREKAAWGAYWAGFIHTAAEAVSTRAYVTEMWDARDLSSGEHRRTWEHPESYDYVDISQVNHQVGQTHWDQLIAFREQIESTAIPRPMNAVKIYGANSGYYGTSRDGQERFWRNLIAGLAAVRFHRPDSGLGCGPIALRNLRAARSFLGQFDLSRCHPAAVQLDRRSANEAFGTGNTDYGFAVFFPDGGDVILRSQIPDPDSQWTLEWLDLRAGTWSDAQPIRFGSKSETRLISPREEGYWLAVLRPGP